MVVTYDYSLAWQQNGFALDRRDPSLTAAIWNAQRWGSRRQGVVDAIIDPPRPQTLRNGLSCSLCLTQAVSANIERTTDLRLYSLVFFAQVQHCPQGIQAIEATAVAACRYWTTLFSIVHYTLAESIRQAIRQKPRRDAELVGDVHGCRRRIVGDLDRPL